MKVAMGLAAVGLLFAAEPPDTITERAGSFIKNNLHLTRYKTASADLNEDGVREILVYADGPKDCGSGGCDLYVLEQASATFRTVTSIGVTRLPVRVLPGFSHGWHDLGVQVAGGGILHGYEARLSFDGRTYPQNPTVPPAKPLTRATGRVVIE